MLVAAPAANAAIIYEDSFNTARNPLTGTGPDVVNTGGATWQYQRAGGSTADAWRAASGVAQWGGGNPGGHTFEYLDFSPTDGEVYTLAATMRFASGRDDKWVGFGFMDSSANSSSNPFFLLQGGTLRDSVRTWDGTSESVDSGIDEPDWGTFSAVLDTTNPGNWAVQWYVGSTAIGSLSTGVQAAGINRVAFGQNGQSSAKIEVDSFSLTTADTAVVPEPASLALWSLTGLCLAGYGVYRRRRRN